MWVCFLQLLCPLSCWSLSVCPRERWGCPAPLMEGTVLSTAGLWMDTHWQTLSSSLEIKTVTPSLWDKTSQDSWSAQSAIMSVASRRIKWYLPVVSENVMKNNFIITTLILTPCASVMISFFSTGFIFIDCISNGTHISQWVLEANNTLCIEQTGGKEACMITFSKLLTYITHTLFKLLLR